MDFVCKKTTDSLYVLSNEAMTWSDAEAFSNSLTGVLTNKTQASGHLVSIGSAAEQLLVSEWVQQTFNDNPAFSARLAPDGGRAAYVWLGGSDARTEGIWEWSDGSAFSYTNWGTGALWNGTGQSSEPDDYQGQDALAMGLETWPSGSGLSQGYGDPLQWNDIDATNLLPPVIEISGDVARLSISDKHIAFDFNGNAGLVARTLGAIFGAESVNNAQYVGIGLSLVDQGMDAETLMQYALNARLGENSTNPEAVVDLLYSNVTGSSPSAATQEYYTSLLDDGTFTTASLALYAANTELNDSNINLAGLATEGLEYYLV